MTGVWLGQVADFNLSRGMTEETVPSSGLVNSPEWSAPERLSGQAYGKAADVFSFGVCVWEMITLGVPWRENIDKGPAGGGEARSTTEDGPFRDQVFHVMNAVPQGSRLVFPSPADVVPAFPEAAEVLPPPSYPCTTARDDIFISCCAGNPYATAVPSRVPITVFAPILTRGTRTFPSLAES